MITHRNAWMNCVGMLTHIRLTAGDAYLWTLPMFHANGWTFTWTVTAAGAKHVCLRKVDPAAVFRLAATENVTWMCAAPTVLIGLALGVAEPFIARYISGSFKEVIVLFALGVIIVARPQILSPRA